MFIGHASPDITLATTSSAHQGLSNAWIAPRLLVPTQAQVKSHMLAQPYTLLGAASQGTQKGAPWPYPLLGLHNDSCPPRSIWGPYIKQRNSGLDCLPTSHLAAAEAQQHLGSVLLHTMALNLWRGSACPPPGQAAILGG